jgi:signal transduction histidine kinase/PAS domain-containing protein
VSEALHARAGPVLLLLAAAATGGAVYVLAVSRIAPNPVAQSLLTALVCLTFVGAGVVALRLPPYAGFGVLLAAVGFASLISVLHDANHAAAYTVGVLASNLVFAVLLHALVAYPSGRLGPISRRAVVAAYLSVTLLQALAVIFDPLTRYHSAHPRNLVLVDSLPGLATGLYELEAAIALALSLVTVVVMIRSVRAATPATRRQHLPMVVGGTIALLLFSLGLVLAPLSSRAGLLGFGGALIAALALPIAFLATLVQGRLSRAAVGELLLELRDPAQPADLEEALRRALGDPTLRLGRLGVDGGYVDGSGVPLALPERGGRLATTAILHQGEPVGMLFHDRTLRLRPGLLDAVNAAAGFALANERALRAAELAEKQTRAVLDAVPDTILRWRRDGLYLEARPDALTAEIFPPEDFVGRKLGDTLPEELARTILGGITRALETGTMQVIEYEVTAGGVRHWREARIVPSGPDEVVAIVRDFTEKRHAEAKVRRLAEEQAALRRVATLVASDAAPEQVFQLVTEEVSRLLGIREAVLERFVDDETGTVVGRYGRVMTGGFEIGSTLPIEEGLTAWQVLHTGAPARVDSFEGAPGELAQRIRALGYRATVGVPIVVAGSIWGALVAALQEGDELPPETERRMQAFAELVGLALASAQAREEVEASRLRIVEASDTERRRLERNLHDGAQQRLVSLSVGLRLVQSKLRAAPEEAEQLLGTLAEELAEALAELRDLAQGIHPAVLSDRGLGPALEVLAARAPLEVELDVDVPERLPEPVETAAYYTVSEALANVAKHADACSAAVRVECDGGQIVVEISDDGNGGADTQSGTGLRGLCDRVETLDGQLLIESPPGQGTVVRAELPVRSGAFSSTLASTA